MTDIPDPLASFLVTRLAPDEALRAALELSTSVPIDPADKLSPSAPLWLVITSKRVLLTAAVDAEQARLEDWPLGEVEVTHEKGLMRDSVRVGDETYNLPMGRGGKTREAIETLLRSAETPPEPVEAPEPTTLPRLGTLWMDKAPEQLVEAVAAHLDKDESVLGLLETGTTVPKPVDRPLWLLVTAGRAALIAVTEGVEGALWQVLAPEGLICERRMTRDAFMKGEEMLFEGPVVGGGSLRRLFELASMPTAARLMDASASHADEKAWEEALGLLELALEALEEDEGPLRAAIELRRAQAFLAMEKEALAFEALTRASTAEPDNDQLDASAALGLKGKTWKLALAMAHQSLDHHRAAASVYAALIEDEPDQDFYRLQQARGLKGAGINESALNCYGAFIAGRIASDEAFLLLENEGTEPDQLDADLAAACLESGLLLESLDRPDEAARRYLTLIRCAPYLEEGYERLFTLADRLPEAAFTIGQAAALLSLLKPDTAQALDDKLGTLPQAPVCATLPIDYTPLPQDTHDETIIHPGERATASVAQKWIGGMVTEANDTGDIERHCQKAGRKSHPLISDLLVRIAHLLSLPTPRCYLSHGNTGVQVLGCDRPFILLGSQHADPDHERHLPPAQLAFALATQMEHIKAGHLLLTASEFWTSFGNRSLEGLMTVLSLIPTASWLGKLTDGVALKWLSALQKRVEGQSLRKLLSLAEDQVKQGKVGEGAQSLLENSLGRLKSEDPGRDSESLVKEQLADFARGALYTADRVGLLVCDDLTAAVDAIMRLSPAAFEEIPAVEAYGLAHVLARRNAEGQLVYRELALRLGELFKFALSEDYADLRRETLRSEAL